MKRILLLTMAVIAFSCLLIGQGKSAKSSGVADEIKKLEQQRNEAILKGDTATLDKLTSDDYTNTTAQGKMEKKADIMDGFKSGKIKFESRELSDLDVRVYGNTAVVTGAYHEKGTSKGKPYEYRDRYTDIWMSIGGNWQLIASHFAVPFKG